jgi:hypothetical protein
MSGTFAKLRHLLLLERVSLSTVIMVITIDIATFITIDAAPQLIRCILIIEIDRDELGWL